MTERAGLSRFDLSGRVALVTGASRGLGQAIAVALAEAGCDLAVADSAGRLRETERRIVSIGRRCVSVSADLAEPEPAVRQILHRILAHYAGVDILVNNAGTLSRGPFETQALESWQRTFAVNVTAPFLLSQGVVPHMKTRRSGKIIHIASLLSFQGGFEVSPYAASKGALALLTKAMSNELAPFGIQVNALAPGYMETEITSDLRRDRVRLRAISERIPTGRWGRPEDLAGPVVFLASAASDYMTGHVLPVDGGWLAR